MSAKKPYAKAPVTEMTQREYYAALAMQALITAGMTDAGQVAKAAVVQADKLATQLANEPIPAWAPGSGPE